MLNFIKQYYTVVKSVKIIESGKSKVYVIPVTGRIFKSGNRCSGSAANRVPSGNFFISKKGLE